MSNIQNVKIDGNIYSINYEIKTINGASLLGEGNLEMDGSSGGPILIWSGSKTVSDNYTTASTVTLSDDIKSKLKNYSMLFFFFCTAGNSGVENPSYFIATVPIFLNKMSYGVAYGTSGPNQSIVFKAVACATVTDNDASLTTRAAGNYPVLRKIYVI